MSPILGSLLAGEPDAILRRWGEEMLRLGAILQGGRSSPYILTAGRAWIWVCFFAVLQGASWEDLDFAGGLLRAPGLRLERVDHLLDTVERLVALGGAVSPAKPALLWAAADCIYRRQIPAERRWTREQIMAAALEDLRKGLAAPRSPDPDPR